MDRTKWIERIFVFDIPPGWIFNVIERLKGTGPRLVDISLKLSNEEAISNLNNKWSIKENIGHLSDLDELHIGRVNDFISRNESLRPADMTNVKTNQGSHNERSLELLIVDFIYNRNHLVSLLEKLDDETQAFQSLHPRLNVLMKPVDMAFFIAEHDDHHLASIREIIKEVTGEK